MDVKAMRLVLGIAAVAVAAALLVSGTYASSAASGDSWMLAEDWDDTKDDEPETTVAVATAPVPPPNDEQITVSGKKTWNHGGNPAALRPAAITLIIIADGAVVLQRRISAADHWAWSFRLPRFNADGKEIAYTVNEARFEDYVKMVDGYNLTNIYMPGRNTDEPYPPGALVLPGGSPPRTDDGSNPALWLAFMGGSLFGLALVIIILRRKRREENRS